MKAAILVEQNRPLVLAQLQVPELAVGQVLVKLEYSGVCGTQLDEINGKRGPDPYLPHLLGHEGSGTVVDVGPGVLKVKAGDRVVLHWMKGSGIESAPPAFMWDSTVVSAGRVTTFSEYTVASENRVTPFPSDVEFDIAALLGCSVTTGLGIVFNDANLKPGQSIAVFGVGGLGVNVVQGAALVNAYPIVAVDLHDDKLEQAIALGATHTVNARQNDVTMDLMKLSGGKGFDVSVAAVGDPEVARTAYEVTGTMGKAIIAGVTDRQKMVAIDAFPLNMGRRISGSHGGATQPDIDIPRYIKLYQLGKLRLDQLITHRQPLDQINEAVELVRSSQAGKQIISMN